LVELTSAVSSGSNQRTLRLGASLLIVPMRTNLGGAAAKAADADAGPEHADAGAALYATRRLSPAADTPYGAPP